MKMSNTIPVATPVKFTKNDVEMLAEDTIFKGFFAIKRYTFRHRLFNGGMSEIIKREVFERGHAAIILPYDPLRDQVILIEQIRIPAIDTSETPWLLELVAGMIEPGESHEEVVRREAEEEAGITINRCLSICSYLASPGGTTERLAVFVGEVDSSIAGGVHGLAEENEDIKVHVVSREQAYHWVEQGIIYNASSIIALQWLQLNYLKLRNEWQQ